MNAKLEPPAPPAPPAARLPVYADILSQAISGELVGMANYAAMVGLHADVEGQLQALASATAERGHAERFSGAARDIGVVPIVNPDAPYWRRVRAAFLRHAGARDLIACLVIQEVMLEAFAVSMYRAVAEVADEPLASVFRAIGLEEAEHVDHATAPLRAALEHDRDAFEAKVESLHEEVMTILAEMLSAQDAAGHCGLCHGSCVKEALPLVGLERGRLRGMALNQYLRTLDAIGVRGERSLAWVARLPL